MSVNTMAQFIQVKKQAPPPPHQNAMVVDGRTVVTPKKSREGST